MIWSLNTTEMTAYVARQLEYFSESRGQFGVDRIERYMPEARRRVEKCFDGIRKKYYWKDGRQLFDHTYGDHYAVFLYFLGNTIYREGQDEDLMAATFSLNRALHGLDAYPGIALPDIFMFAHPLGTVLGRAQYSNYLVVYQGVTVGSTEDGLYPAFAEGVVLFSGVSVIGQCRVGPDVIFGARSFIYRTDVPARTTVVGMYPCHKYLPVPGTVKERFFR